MRKLRALIFLAVGIVLGLLFLDEFFFHVRNGDAIHYAFMALFAIGSIGCVRAARTDWRAARQVTKADRRGVGRR